MDRNASPSLRARAARVAARWLVSPSLSSSAPPAARRARLERVARYARLPPPPCTRVEPATFRGVPGEWVRNARVTPRRTVLYLHGGAYVLGSTKVYRELTTRIVRAWSAQVAAINYRLAPEHPFPCATEDALDAYRALLEQGIAAKDIVIAGDSAGGGLALACVLQARDSGLPLPAQLVLFSPWVDLTVSGHSAAELKRDDILDAERLRASAEDYLAGERPTAPLASPLFADLHGLPPTLIQVTDREILLDDSRRLLDALHAAGSPADLRVWPGLWHVWQVFAGLVPEADAALAEAAVFLDRGHSP